MHGVAIGWAIFFWGAAGVFLVMHRFQDWRDKRNPERVVRRDRKIMKELDARAEINRRGEEKWGRKYDEDGISLWPTGAWTIVEREIKAERRAAKKAEKVTKKAAR